VKSRKAKERGERANFDEGPMTMICGSAMGPILDQSLLLGNLEFTVSTLVEATGLTYKTVKSCLSRLEKMKPGPWVTPTRKLGNAQAYKFNVENHMSSFVKWATEYQMSRLNSESDDKC